MRSVTASIGAGIETKTRPMSAPLYEELLKSQLNLAWLQQATEALSLEIALYPHTTDGLAFTFAHFNSG